MALLFRFKRHDRRGSRSPKLGVCGNGLGFKRHDRRGSRSPRTFSTRSARSFKRHDRRGSRSPGSHVTTSVPNVSSVTTDADRVHREGLHTTIPLRFKRHDRRGSRSPISEGTGAVCEFQASRPTRIAFTFIMLLKSLFPFQASRPTRIAFTPRRTRSILFSSEHISPKPSSIFEHPRNKLGF